MVESMEKKLAGSSWKFTRLLRVWFGVREEVPPRLYAISGFGLMFFKFVVEACTIYYFTGNLLMPWDFLSPLLSSRTSILQQAPEWLGWTLFAWNLPFVWIAFSMSVRRAADTGASPWVGMLVLVPLLNLPVMLALAFASSDGNRHWNFEQGIETSERPSGSHYRRALLAIGVGLTVGFMILGISLHAFHLYGATLFFGGPLMMGACAGFIYNRPQTQTWLGTLGVVSLLMLATGGTLLLFALEGVICLAMAAPLVFPLGLIGGAIGKGIADETRAGTRQMTSALLVLPVLAGTEAMTRPTPEYVVLTMVEINAPPEKVWRYVVEFPDLPEPDEWLFKIGVACPLRARIEGQGINAVRYCEFTTGTFVEPITVWDEPSRLAFDVLEQPDPMFELSPYRHLHPPHMEHQALKSHRGEFRLTPLPGGRTRLEGRTWYTFEMYPQSYWTLWSNSSIHRIHVRVLEHIKRLSESEHGSQQLTSR